MVDVGSSSLCDLVGEGGDDSEGNMCEFTRKKCILFYFEG